MDVKMTVSNKYMMEQVKGIHPRRLLSVKGDSNIWKYDPLNEFCVSNEEGQYKKTFIIRWTLI